MKAFERLTILALLLVLATVGPGCLGSQEDPGASQVPVGDRDPADAGGLTATAAAYDTEGCMEVIGLFLMDPGQAQDKLPDGFMAADAQGLLGLPVEAGRAAAFINVYTCASASTEQGPLHAGEVAIYVQPPDLGAAFDTSDSTFDFYQFSAFTSGPGTLAAYRDMGARAVEAELTLEVGAVPVGPAVTGTASVEDEEGLLYTFEYAAPGQASLEGIVRLWHLTATGTAVVDLDIPEHPVLQGTLTGCAIRAGSVVHEVLGTTDCTGQQNPVVVFPEQGWDGVLRHLPGVQPAST